MPLDPGLANKLVEAAQDCRLALDQRNRLICEAADAGGSLREIAECVALHHTGVRKIIARGPSAS